MPFGAGLQLAAFSLVHKSGPNAIDVDGASQHSSYAFNLVLSNEAAAFAAEAVITAIMVPKSLPTQPSAYPLKQQLVAFTRTAAVRPGASLALA